jgi:hypothetical protein
MACKVFFFKVLFFKGFAIDFSYKLIAFYLALIILADKSSFLLL